MSNGTKNNVIEAALFELSLSVNKDLYVTKLIVHVTVQSYFWAMDKKKDVTEAVLYKNCAVSP